MIVKYIPGLYLKSPSLYQWHDYDNNNNDDENHDDLAITIA